MPTLTASSVGYRRYFPAWIESDDRAPTLTLGTSLVLPRVRAALPLRRVLSSSSALISALERKSSDERRSR